MDLEQFMKGLAASQAALTETVAGLAKAISQHTPTQPPAARQEAVEDCKEDLKQIEAKNASIYNKNLKTLEKEGRLLGPVTLTLLEEFSDKIVFELALAWAKSARFGVFAAKYWAEEKAVSVKIDRERGKDPTLKEIGINKQMHKHDVKARLYFACVYVLEQEYLNATRGVPQNDYAEKIDHGEVDSYDPEAEEWDGQEEGFNFNALIQSVKSAPDHGGLTPDFMLEKMAELGGLSYAEYKAYEKEQDYKQSKQREATAISYEQARQETRKFGV